MLLSLHLIRKNCVLTCGAKYCQVHNWLNDILWIRWDLLLLKPHKHLFPIATLYINVKVSANTDRNDTIRISLLHSFSLCVSLSRRFLYWYAGYWIVVRQTLKHGIILALSIYMAGLTSFVQIASWKRCRNASWIIITEKNSLGTIWQVLDKATFLYLRIG